MGFLKYALGLGLGVGLLFYALWRVDWTQLKANLASANYWWVLGGLGFALASHYLRAARWKLLLSAAGYETHTPSLFASIMVGYLVNNAIPRSGEISRATLTSRSEKIPFGVSFGTVVTDRIMDMIALLLIGGTVFLLQTDLFLRCFQEAFTPDLSLTGGSPKQPSGIPWLWIVAGLGVTMLVLTWLFRKKLAATKLGQKIISFGKEMWGAIITVRNLKSPGLFLLFSIGIWLGYFLQFYSVFWAFSGSEKFGPLFALVSFTMGTLGMVFPSPGGVGSFHYAVLISFLAFLAPTGIATPDSRAAVAILGNSVAILNHTSQLLMMILFGFISYLFLIPRLGGKSIKETP